MVFHRTTTEYKKPHTANYFSLFFFFCFLFSLYNTHIVSNPFVCVCVSCCERSIIILHVQLFFPTAVILSTAVELYYICRTGSIFHTVGPTSPAAKRMSSSSFIFQPIMNCFTLHPPIGASFRYNLNSLRSKKYINLTTNRKSGPIFHWISWRRGPFKLWTRKWAISLWTKRVRFIFNLFTLTSSPVYLKRGENFQKQENKLFFFSGKRECSQYVGPISGVRFPP